MIRALRLTSLVFAIGLMGSSPAEAGFWDWLEELNGPGPSTGRRPPVMANLFCTEAQARQTINSDNFGAKIFNRVLRIAESPRANSTCVFTDYHAFGADDDSRFYPVDTSLWEVGTSTRLHPTLEIGAAIGRLSFSSQQPNNPEISGSRLTISFPRVVFRPLAAIPGAPFNEDAGWGFLQVYFKYTIVKGALDQTDFASKPDTVFERTNQRVESVGFVIDAASLLSLFE
jgi:hypothetical protein